MCGEDPEVHCTIMVSFVQSADGRGFMSKTELCNKAQELADKSFTVVSQLGSV